MGNKRQGRGVSKRQRTADAGEHSDQDHEQHPQSQEPYKREFTHDQLAYDQRDFHNPANDNNGQSVRVVFRCPPQMERALEVIRDNKGLPYETISDVVRHAISRHLDWLHIMAPDLPKHYLVALSAIRELCQDEDMAMQTQQAFDRIQGVIDRHLAAGDTEEAMRLMSQARSKVNMCQESRWKRDWLHQFQMRYAHYLQPVQHLPPNAPPPVVLPALPPPSMSPFPGGSGVYPGVEFENPNATYGVQRDVWSVPPHDGHSNGRTH